MQFAGYAAVIVEAVRREKPQILLCGATSVGRSLCSRIAVTLGTGTTPLVRMRVPVYQLGEESAYYIK